MPATGVATTLIVDMSGVTRILDGGKAGWEEIRDAAFDAWLGELLMGIAVVAMDLWESARDKAISIGTEIGNEFQEIRDQGLSQWARNDGLDHASNLGSGIVDTMSPGLTKRIRGWIGVGV